MRNRTAAVASHVSRFARCLLLSLWIFALALSGCAPPPQSPTALTIVSSSVPEDIFTVQDEVMAFTVQGEAGSTGEVEIALTPLRARIPGLADVVLLQHSPGPVTELPFTKKDTNIVATLAAGGLYVVFARPTGRLLDIYYVLCRVDKHRSEIEEAQTGLADSVCKLVLCSPGLLKGSDVYARFPALVSLRSVLNIDDRQIGGWGTPSNVCNRCEKFATPGLVSPVFACADVPVNPGGVVDMIPASLSGETNQDSEPFLAVDFSNPQRMVGTAFTPNPFGTSDGTAPVYVTTDGGATWSLNLIVPSAGQVGTSDITVAGSGTALRLYSGIIRVPGNVLLNILRTTDFTSPAPMTVQSSREEVDQPFAQAGTVGGTDRVYVGDNDFNASNGRTATVDMSLDGGITLRTVRIETRGTAGQDGPSVRPVVARDGTVYVAYFGWRNFDGSTATSDVVVVRDDNGGTGGTPFQSLKDPSDNRAGRIVASSVKIPWSNVPTLGFERIGSTLSLAVDPGNSANVYIAWADRIGGGDIYSLHVRRSTDRGVTWSNDLRVIRNATCCALSAAENGTTGFLYQQLAGSGSAGRWVTHLEQTRDAFVHVTDIILANVPADAPTEQFLPYLGDYNYVLSVGGEFRGVFCANNTPDPANFPSGVRFQRNVDFSTKKLKDGSGNTVEVSIDPFYFHIPAIQ